MSKTLLSPLPSKAAARFPIAFHFRKIKMFQVNFHNRKQCAEKLSRDLPNNFSNWLQKFNTLVVRQSHFSRCCRCRVASTRMLLMEKIIISKNVDLYYCAATSFPVSPSARKYCWNKFVSNQISYYRFRSNEHIPSYPLYFIFFFQAPSADWQWQHIRINTNQII